ncbi:MAG: tRNA 2-selenouridine(34) synthase MnmH [Burkholderiales bacterium]
MSLLQLAAAEAVARLGEFDAIIDCRSEGEFALDHLPRARNWPSLSDAERHLVGTIHAETGAFDAHKRGAALVSANIARHLEAHLSDLPRNWRPLVYCWRGGKRSGSLALVLSQIGFNVCVIDGGYKAFRAAMVADLPRAVQRLSFRVICGPTGSGKTRLLSALADAGAQVLDLEALASHRSSVLGLIPGQPQPTQKRFDTLVWTALESMDQAREVFVESESKKVGNLAVPDALMTAMRASACFDLHLDDAERVALLLEDYRFFVDEPELFCERLGALTALRGHDVVQSWQQQVRAGQTNEVVRELLATHYDPGYLQSMRRNFVQFNASETIAPEDRSASAMGRLAQEILAEVELRRGPPDAAANRASLAGQVGRGELGEPASPATASPPAGFDS